MVYKEGSDEHRNIRARRMGTFARRVSGGAPGQGDQISLFAPVGGSHGFAADNNLLSRTLFCVVV